MKLTLKDIEPYISEGLVNLKDHPSLPIQLACYTKRCFYDGRWSDVTKRCRGLLFDENGIQCNYPVPKMFNIGEQPETLKEVVIERLENEEYGIQDKCNGHLSILSCYKDTWINTTKGTFDHEFVPQDRILLNRYIEILNIHENDYSNCTFNFEIIAQYDKHTMYDTQSDQYGQNVAVLLCVYDNETGESLSTDIHPEIIDAFKYQSFIADDLDLMYTDKEREGYVITFEDGTKVKVKTQEYMFMRYEKEMEGGAKMKKLFRQFERDVKGVQAEIPEEYYHFYDQVIDDYDDFTEKFLALCQFYVDNIKTDEMTDKEVAAIIKTKPPMFIPYLFMIYKGFTKKPKGLKRLFSDEYDFSYRE